MGSAGTRQAMSPQVAASVLDSGSSAKRVNGNPYAPNTRASKQLGDDAFGALNRKADTSGGKSLLG